MKTPAQLAIEAESGFLAGVSGNVQAAQSRLVAGKFFKIQEHDGADRVRGTLADRRIYDRSRLAELPQGRGFTMRGYERKWIFGRRLRSVTAVGVVAPVEPLLDGKEPAPPVSLGQLNAQVRELVKDTRVPHLVGVCSPSGFDDSALQAAPEMPNVTLVLIQPKPGGGWDVRGAGGKKVDERLLRIFDPEDAGQKLDRVRKEIANRRIDLLTGGLSAGSMASRLGVPARMVQTAFEMAAQEDGELCVSKRAGDVLLFRGAADFGGREESSMSLAQWIRNLFSTDGQEARKINVLSERRAALSERLNRMYDDIGQLEKKEADLVGEGQAATSQVVKRRIASQIAHLRKDISRSNTSAALMSKQINIISTHIHNLQLAQAGSVAELPSSEELTEAAVNAEEMLEQLSASDELVSSMEVNAAQAAISSEEADILKELEGPTASAAPASPEAVPPVPQASRESKRSERAGPAAE